MRVSKFKITLVFLSIFSVTSCQIFPSFADAKNKKLRVAFIGIKFENVSPDVQDVSIHGFTLRGEDHREASCLQVNSIDSALNVGAINS